MKFELSDEEVLAPIYRRLDRIEEKVDLALKVHAESIKLSRQKSVWTISDIGSVYDKSYDSMRTTYRYLLPRFGESAFEEGKARWPLDEALDWMNRPIEEKKRLYQEHIRQQAAAEARKRRKTTG